MVTRPTLTETNAERVAREGALQVEQSDMLKAIRGFFEIFGLGGFFNAIVGAFNDNQRDADEMPAGTTAAPSNRPSGTAQALALLQALGGNEKLRGLMGQYASQGIPAPISPFANNARITSHYGKREAPRDANGNIVGSSNHGGIDMVGGPEVHATMPGVVVFSGTQRDANGKMAGYGHWVEVAGVDGKRYRYAHLAEKVPYGTVLAQGDFLGMMGNTGHGTGAHLHYEVRDASGTNTLAPELGGRVYARNDRSYVNANVAPAEAQRYASKPQPGRDALASLPGGPVQKLPTASGYEAPRAPVFAGVPKSTLGAVAPAL